MATNYTTKTAALKATKADINKIDAKKMLLDGKNILDYISDSEFDSYDTRDPQLKNDELDIWNTEIGLSDNGHIEVKPLEHTDATSSSTQKSTIHSAVKIIDNEVLGENDAHLMYWQTDGLKKCWGLLYQSHIESFSSDLSSLTEGQYMFSDCNELESFSSDLSSLTDGEGMFNVDSKLKSFNSNLPSLTNGERMFCYNFALSEFNSDLSSLVNGNCMFTGCVHITTFSSDLSSLTNGNYMFCDCYGLTEINADLSSLTNAHGMFEYCKLDAPSVANIVHTLPTHESNGNIAVGIGCDNTEADQLLFAQECDCETWQELLDEFSAKNWIVEIQCKGRPTTTYNMRRGETLPIYAKLVEVIMPTDENERKPRYAYTSADGSKFFNINYFHSTNGSTEGYDVFSSLEEAISTYNVTPKN